MRRRIAGDRPLLYTRFRYTGKKWHVVTGRRIPDPQVETVSMNHATGEVHEVWTTACKREFVIKMSDVTKNPDHVCRHCRS